MADTTPSRRSGRQRVPNRKYANDAFEVLNNVLSSDSEEDGVLQALQADPTKDHDFPAEEVVQISEDEVDSIVSDGSAIMTPNEDSEDAESYGSPESPSMKTTSRKGSKSTRQSTTQSTQPVGRSTGIPDFTKTHQKESRLEFFAGKDSKDIKRVVWARDRWASDPTLPRRSNMCHLPLHTEEKREMEATVGWDWYYDQGGQAFLTGKQQVFSLLADEGIQHIPRPVQEPYELLMGPYGRQKLFSLSFLQSLGLHEMWYSAIKEHNPDMPQGSQKQQRRGWMLNAGTRIRCLDWASNQESGPQYLAVATARPRSRAPAKEAPGLTPASPTPSSIQIWAFPMSTTPVNESTMDSSRSAKLVQVICTNWGDVKQLKWCPMPRRFRDENMQGKVPLGLLAGVWDDGYARILDIQLDMETSEPISYLKVDIAAFTARLANTISTCLTWLSATDLAVGYANGFLAVYDICPLPTRAAATTNTNAPPTSTSHPTNPPHATSPSSLTNPAPTTPPNPWLLTPLPHSPLLSLTPTYPLRPSLLTASSLSGSTLLLSLPTPTLILSSRRATSPPSTLLYHPALNCIIHPDATRDWLSAYSLRQWGSGTPFASTAGQGGVGAGCVDVGRVHPCVAWGGRDGGVRVTNPMIRALKGRRTGSVLQVFKHEWVRRKRPASTAVRSEVNNPHAFRDVVEESAAFGGDAVSAVPTDGSGNEPAHEMGERRGISRILESFHAEEIFLDPGRRGPNAYSTIFEEETGVTALAWNPNLSCGSWLAVGCGSGLLRVQDLGI